jgi:hypothetical protein
MKSYECDVIMHQCSALYNERQEKGMKNEEHDD